MSDQSCPITRVPNPYPTCLGPGSPGVPIVARDAELAMSTFGVVLAEAEPAEVVAVATAWVPMSIALAGPAAARARGVAKAAGPAPFAVLPPGPVCEGPSSRTESQGQGWEGACPTGSPDP